MILLLISACGILIFLHKTQLPTDTFLWRAIANAGHIPLFGVLSLIMLSLSQKAFGSRIHRRYLHYIIAFMVTVLIGVASEAVQIWGLRDAAASDVFRDAIGGASFLALYMTRDSRMFDTWKRRGHRSRTIILSMALLLILAGISPVILCGGAYLHRNRAFPQICSFDSIWERMFWTTQDSHLTVTSPPEGWKKAVDDHVGKLTLKPATYPGFTVMEPVPDWDKYEYLVFEIYSELDSMVRLTLRIEDIHHDNTYADRFNCRVVVNPGLNPVRIDLSKVREAPRSREMDMSTIYAICLFTSKPKKPFTLFLDNFELQ